MNCRGAAVGLSLTALLWLVPELAACAEPGARPLQLRLANPPVTMAATQMALNPARNAARFRASNAQETMAANQRMPRFAEAEPSLKQRALQSVLEPPEQNLDELSNASGQPAAQFRFERRGPAIRDLRRSYKDMCANVSNKIWDDPNGKKIKFDIAGKPGVAIEIPLR